MSERTAASNDLIRRIADCLEQHLPAYGFEPYRYPSGENKSVDLIDGEVLLLDAHGQGWTLSLAPRRTTTPTRT